MKAEKIQQLSEILAESYAIHDIDLTDYVEGNETEEKLYEIASDIYQEELTERAENKYGRNDSGEEYEAWKREAGL